MGRSNLKYNIMFGTAQEMIDEEMDWNNKLNKESLSAKINRLLLINTGWRAKQRHFEIERETLTREIKKLKHKIEREKYIKEIAEACKHLISEKLYQAMMNYIVEITD